MDGITPENVDAPARDVTRFFRLVEICPNGIGIFSDNQLVQCNSSLAALVNAPAAQLAGTSLESLIAPDLRQTTVRKLEEMHAAGLHHDTTCGTRLCRSDGAEIDVEASVDTLELDGECDRVVVFRPSAPREAADSGIPDW